MQFSVIVPAYNCADTLAATVESIRHSGLDDYELWLVDDGSTDGTPALCDALSAQYAEVNCVHQQNAGVSAARNRGMEQAQGDYLLFFDSDDSVAEQSLAGAVRIIQDQAPDLLIFGMQFDYYHRGRRYRQDLLLPPLSGAIDGAALQSAFASFYDCNALTSACNKIFRSTLIRTHGIRFRDGMILMEDFLFVLDTLPFCKTVFCLQEPIYRYRQGEDERNAYRRLCRTPDLAAYLHPFEESMHKLDVPDGTRFVSEKLYPMLLQQKLYYAPLSEIRNILAQHRSGPYASLDFGKPLPLYLKNKKTQLRHRLAVAVKVLLYPYQQQRITP